MSVSVSGSASIAILVLSIPVLVVGASVMLDCGQRDLALERGTIALCVPT